MKPILQAMLIADNVYCDKHTGKKVIAGIFNRLTIHRHQEIAPGNEAATRQPIKIRQDAGSPTLYINLAEVRGHVPLTLRLVDLRDNSVLFEAESVIHNENPLQNTEIILRLPRLPCNRAGVHALELLSQGEPIGSLRIQVQEASDRSSDAGDDEEGIAG